MSPPDRALIPTGSTITVEDLLRYSAHRFQAAGIEFCPPKMSRLIRRAGRDRSLALIDAYLDTRHARRATGATRTVLADTWSAFELFVNGHADPTAMLALRNVARDSQRALRGNGV